MQGGLAVLVGGVDGGLALDQQAEDLDVLLDRLLLDAQLADAMFGEKRERCVEILVQDVGASVLGSKQELAVEPATSTGGHVQCRPAVLVLCVDVDLLAVDEEHDDVLTREHRCGDVEGGLLVDRAFGERRLGLDETLDVVELAELDRTKKRHDDAGARDLARGYSRGYLIEIEIDRQTGLGMSECVCGARYREISIRHSLKISRALE